MKRFGSLFLHFTLLFPITFLMDPASAEVSSSGAYTASIPIEVPPGINGLTPELSLIYNSDNAGQGPIGVGWGLTAGSVIMRVGPGRQLPDNRWVFPLSAPTLSESDLFYLDGQRLVPCDGNGDPTSCPPGTYRTAQDNFARMEKDEVNAPNWRITKDDGTILEYGQYVIATGQPDSFDKRVAWYLTRIVKPGPGYGSGIATNPTIDFAYETMSGQPPLLSTIEYGGFEVRNDPLPPTPPLHKFRVALTWGDREDVRESYRSGAHLSFNKKLEGIFVSTIGSPGNRLRKYVLGYEYSPVSGLSRLCSVQQFGVTDGASLPPFQMTYYDDSEVGFMSEPDPNWILPYYAEFTWDTKFPSGVWPVDANADGRIDLVRRAYDEEHYDIATGHGCNPDWINSGIWINQGDGTWERDAGMESELRGRIPQSLERYWWARHEYYGSQCTLVENKAIRDRGVLPIDLNGDGYLDYLYSHRGWLTWTECDGDPGEAGVEIYGYQQPILTDPQGMYNCWGPGNPYMDYYALHLGQPGGALVSSNPLPWLGTSAQDIRLILSWDGDRYYTGGPYAADYYWLGSQRCGRFEPLPKEPFPSYGPGTTLMDVNGDQLPDAVVLRGWWESGQWTYEQAVYLNTSTGLDYATQEAWAIPDPAPDATYPLAFVLNHDIESFPLSNTQLWGNKLDLGLRLVDVNGDGLPDLVQSYRDVRCRGGSDLPALQNAWGGGSYTRISDGSSAGWVVSVPGDQDPLDTLAVVQDVYLNTGRGWEWSESWSTSLRQFGDMSLFTEVNRLTSACGGGDLTQYEAICYGGNQFPEGPSTAYQNNPRGVDLVDINGDGLADIVKKDFPDPYGLLPEAYVFLNTGTGWSSEDATQWHLPIDPTGRDDIVLCENCASDWGQPCNGESGIKFFDYNADGMLDIAVFRDEVSDPGQSKPNTEGNGLFGNRLDVKQDRLQLLTNPLGGKEAITYELLTANSPQHNVLAPKLVTSQVTASAAFDATSGPVDLWQAATSYHYAGGESDPATKWFVGFRVVTKELPPTDGGALFQSSWINNRVGEPCCVGRIEATMTSEHLCEEGDCVYDAAYSPVTVNVASLKIHEFSEALWDTPCSEKYPTGSYGPYFHPSNESQSSRWDPNALGTPWVDTKTRVVREVNGFRRILESQTYLTGESSTPLRRTVHQYHEAPNTTDWIVSLPKAILQYDDNGNLRRDKTYYYDGASDPGTAPTAGYVTRIYERGNSTSGALDSETWVDYTYTEAGNRWVVTDANNVATTTQWADPDWPELVPSATVAAGNVTTYDYDGFARLETATDPNGVHTTTIYDDLSRPESIASTHNTDPAPMPTKELSYTVLTPYGLAVKEIATLEGARTVETETLTDGLGHNYLSVTRGRTGQTMEDEVAVSRVYGQRGEILEETLAYGGALYDMTQPKVSAQYDPLGRVISRMVPGNYADSTFYRIYSAAGQDYVWVELKRENGTRPWRRHTLSDPLGRVVQVTECDTGTCNDPMGTGPGVEKTKYFYTYADQLSAVLLANGVTRSSIFYDGLGRKIGLKDPDLCNCSDSTPTALTGGCAIRYVYDNVGNMVEYRSAQYAIDPVNGSRIVNDYDQYGRLNHRQTYGQFSYSYLYTYDISCLGGPNYLEGRVGQTTVSFAGGSEYTDICYQYDSLGRVTQTQQTVAIPGQSAKLAQHTYTYSESSSLKTIAVLATGYTASLAYEYDSFGRVERIEDSGGQPIVSDVLYNPLGQVTHAQLGTAAATLNFMYRDGDPSTSAGDRRLQRVYTTNPSVYDMTYSYDAIGNISQLLDATDINATFGYDHLGRLTSMTADGILTEQYDYDVLGNRVRYDYLVEQSSGGGKPPDPPIGEGLTGLGGEGATLDGGESMVMKNHYAAFGTAWGGTAGPHALRCFDDQTNPCSSPTLSLSYDRNGRVSSYSDIPQGTGCGYTYHPNGKLKEMSCGGVPTRSYFGPGDDKVAEIDNGVVRYFFSPSYEYDGGSHVFYVFFNGARVAKRVGAAAWQYFVNDHLGSMRISLDSNGVVQKGVHYWPFGANRATSGGGGLPGYLFNGNRKNTYGVYDYSARSYLPYLGVFLQADDVVADPMAPQSLNRYTYVLNDPVGRIDPTGHASDGALTLWVNQSFGIGYRESGWSNDGSGVIMSHGAIPWGSGTLEVNFLWVDEQLADPATREGEAARQNTVYGIHELGWQDDDVVASLSKDGYPYLYNKRTGERAFIDPDGTVRLVASGAVEEDVTVEAVIALGVSAGGGGAGLLASGVAAADFRLSLITLQLMSRFGLTGVVANVLGGGGGAAGSGIKISERGLAHALERHAAGGARIAGNSIFNEGEDIVGLIRAAGSVAPAQQVGGNFERIVDAGRMVGIDRATGRLTSIYTVITNAASDFITAFPGRP